MFSHLSIQFIFVPLKFQVDIEIKEQQLRCSEHLPCIKYSEFQRGQHPEDPESEEMQLLGCRNVYYALGLN